MPYHFRVIFITNLLHKECVFSFVDTNIISTWFKCVHTYSLLTFSSLAFSGKSIILSLINFILSFLNIYIYTLGAPTNSTKECIITCPNFFFLKSKVILTFNPFQTCFLILCITVSFTSTDKQLIQNQIIQNKCVVYIIYMCVYLYC